MTNTIARDTMNAATGMSEGLSVEESIEVLEALLDDPFMPETSKAEAKSALNRLYLMDAVEVFEAKEILADIEDGNLAAGAQMVAALNAVVSGNATSEDMATIIYANIKPL